MVNKKKIITLEIMNGDQVETNVELLLKFARTRGITVEEIKVLHGTIDILRGISVVWEATPESTEEPVQ